MKTASTPQILADRYQISGRIGSGGMGEVLRARDSVLGRIVALKVLPSELSMQPEFVERFRAEAQAAARLSHPNVVQVHDWGEEDSTYYMVMEYVRGRNLRQILSSVGRFEPSQAVEVLEQVLRALDAAHSKGLVHRDIKPENIIVATDGTVKVTDFGIARVIQAAGLTGSMLGTVAYAAPEQAKGDPVDGRTDLYSAGCVLYELLTGSLPFEGDAARILHQHLTERVPRPSTEVLGAAPLDRIVMRSTEPVISDRYGSAVEMETDLKSASTGLPPAAPLAELTHELTSEVSADSIETVMRARKKKKRWGRWLLGVLAVMAVVAGWAMFRPVRVPEVIGLVQADAENRIENAGLTPKFTREFSTASEDTVFKTDPGSGQKVRRGGDVLLSVSNGPELTDAPTVIGIMEEAAKSSIKKAGLVVGKIERKNDLKAAGIVLEQDPKPGRIRRGNPINLIVSSGPQVLDIPSVIGQSAAEAEATLTQLGFMVTREQVFADGKSGTVTGQVPNPGERAEQGTSVKLLISQGPKPFAMPDVKGKACSDAKSQLEGAGMVVVARSSSGQAATCGSGKILEQDPLSGSQVRKGQEATLYL